MVSKWVVELRKRTVYRQVFPQAGELGINDSRTKGRRKSLPLSVPPRVVHLSKQRVSTQGLKAFVLGRCLGPVLVGNLGDERRLANVDGAVPRAIPLATVVSLASGVFAVNSQSERQSHVGCAICATSRGCHPPWSDPGSPSRMI